MNVNRKQTQPLQVPRSRRNHALQVLTSMPAGKAVPLAAVPLLREDALKARMRVAVEMLETKELLMNPVNLRVTAYLVPLLALERFQGSRDQFDRSYMGQPQVDGGAVVPFIETHGLGTPGANAVYKALGLHGLSSDLVNTAYLEAYNAIWNLRAKNRSMDITPRGRLTTTLAPAFWQHSRFQHIVPDFDQAVIDGEVALNIVEARLPVKGIGYGANPAPGAAAITTIKETDAAVYRNVWGHSIFPNNQPPGAGIASLVVETGQGHSDPDIYVNMDNANISISLSNIEMAKKAQWFAKLRQRFEGHDDDYIIDMLMDGLTIPEQHLKQPILLADQTVKFAQAKRYATDAGNLAESAVSGGAVLDLSIRCPRVSTGGVVMIIAEAVPEQLFERQRDPFFHSTNADVVGDNATWPEFVRDSMDPEKVDIVKNGEIDTRHATPNATFGYAPMNWKWNAWGPRIGGKFYRPTTDAGTDEERQRLWAVETANPVLSEHFYLVHNIHTKPFLDTQSDPFEAVVAGGAVIEGNTQFGGLLVEATGNYDKIMDDAPTERIDKPE